MMSKLCCDVSNVSARCNQVSAINKIHVIVNYDDYTLTLHDKKYVPPPTGLAFHRCNDRVRTIRGHVGSGKTTTLCAEIIFRVCAMPPCIDGKRKARCAVIRNTYGDLIRTTIKTWKQWYENLGNVKAVQSPAFIIKHDFNATIIRNGVSEDIKVELELLPIALDNNIDILKHLKSLEVTFVFLNELSELNKLVIDFFTGGRMPRYPASWHFHSSVTKYWSGIFCDTNPPEEDSWIYNLFEVDKPPEYKMFVQPPAVIKQADGKYIINPKAENVDNILNGREEYIKMTYGKSENFINVYLMGEYGTLTDEKKVYYNYNDNIHSVDTIEIDKEEPLILSADLGTVAPTILLAQLVGAQRRIIKEFCGQFMTITELVNGSVMPYLKLNCMGMRIAVVLHDPADTYDGAAQLKEVWGEAVIAAETNSIERRIDAVTRSLNILHRGEAAYIISREGCPQLRKGFNGLYFYRRLRIIGEERYTEEPHKNHPYSDCISNNTKILLSNNTEILLKHLRVGMCVKTKNGIGKVTKIWLARKNAVVYKYKFDNGCNIIATSDHRVFTSNGWKRLCDLSANDVLWSIKNYRGELCLKTTLKSFVKFVIKNLKHLLGVLNRGKEYIAQIIVDTLGKEQEQGLLLTANGLHLTVGNIMNTKEKREKQQNCTDIFGKRTMGKYLKECAFTIKTGIDLTMHWKIWNYLIKPNIRSCMLEKEWWKTQKFICAVSRQLKKLLGLTGKRRNLFAQYAKKLFINIIKQNIVQKNVRTNSEIYETHLVSKRRCLLKKNVYDLTVEKEHCFFANGLLVHNCHDSNQYICLWCNKELGYTITEEEKALSEHKFKQHRNNADRITGY